MEHRIFAVAIVMSCMGLPVQAQETARDKAEAAEVCAKNRLSEQESVDCRAQLNAASTEAERQKVRQRFEAAGRDRKAGVPAQDSTPKTDGHTSTVTEPDRSSGQGATRAPSDRGHPGGSGTSNPSGARPNAN